jgi:hypothetical protein
MLKHETTVGQRNGNLVCALLWRTLASAGQTAADLPLLSQYVAATLILVQNYCRNFAYLELSVAQ